MAEDKLKGTKLNKDGYGFIPKSVMQDKNLSIATKAVYAYFCSFTGAGDCCFPTRKKICFDLGISNDSLSKYIKQLIENGYLIVEQVKENGRFSHNIYTLPDTKLPCPKISDTVNSDTDKMDTKNNISKNNNNSKSNSSLKDIYISEFETLWKLYPNKKGKENALKSYIKARNKGVSFETVKQGIINYTKECEVKHRDKQYIKHGSTWFNSQGWEDEYDLTPCNQQNTENKKTEWELPTGGGLDL